MHGGLLKIKEKMTPIRWNYLLAESSLLILLSYLVLFGGTFIGMSYLALNKVNLILVVLLGAAWFAWHWIRRRPFPHTALDLPIAGVVVAVSLATILSSDPRRSAIILTQVFIYVLVYFCLVDLFSEQCRQGGVGFRSAFIQPDRWLLWLLSTLIWVHRLDQSGRLEPSHSTFGGSGERFFWFV